MARLTNHQVHTILTSSNSARVEAQRHGVSNVMIGNIRRRKNWRRLAVPNDVLERLAKRRDGVGEHNSQAVLTSDQVREDPSFH